MKGANRSSDRELMRAYQRGEEAAFEELYRRYGGKVYAYLKSRLRDETVTQDVFQSVFLKLHRSRARYDESFEFAPWLFAVVRSVMLDSLRKNARPIPEPALDPAPAGPEPDRAFDRGVLGAIGERQRQAVSLRYEQDLSFEEIARRLETTPENARQIVSRAVRRLREILSLKGEAHDTANERK